MKRNLTAFIIVFLLGLVFNFVWENLHHVLYVHYKGGEITDFILFRAALFDASFITLVFGPVLVVRGLRKYWWVSVLVALCFAIGLELWALDTSRWAYKETMPIIPTLGAGLSPTVQLALTGSIAVWIARIFYFKRGV